MSTVTLREYVARLGFRTDEAQQRRFMGALESITKSTGELTKKFANLAVASLATGTVLGTAMEKTGKVLESVYFAAQRTGASAKELDVFSYAAERIGISAEQARASIEGLAAARRTTLGLNGILARYGINPAETDNAKVLIELLGKLRQMPQPVAAQIAGMFGIDEDTLNQFRMNPSDAQRFMKQREDQIKKEGINLDKQAATAHEFSNKQAAFNASMRDLNNTTQTRNMDVGGGIVGWLNKVTERLTAADQATHGWSSRLLEAGAALGGLKASGWLLKLLTGGGRAAAGAAAGEGIAVGAAEAGGAGILETVALPAIIIAAVGAALVWMMVHKDQVRKFVSDTWNTVKTDTKQGAAALKQSVHDMGIGKTLLLQGGILGDLGAMILKFEGFRDHVYKDVAGKRTFGVGHLVKPGEDMSHADPMALFEQDLKSSMFAVLRAVKVRLSDNQLKALADLEFNIGEKAFDHSTLLRKLNKGDIWGAGNEFAQWNKVLQNGHYVANEALSNRRATEAQMFRTPDVQISQKNEYNITSTDPRGAADEVDRKHRRANGDIVRNFATAVK